MERKGLQCSVLELESGGGDHSSPTAGPSQRSCLFGFYLINDPDKLLQVGGPKSLYKVPSVEERLWCWYPGHNPEGNGRGVEEGKGRVGKRRDGMEGKKSESCWVLKPSNLQCT